MRTLAFLAILTLHLLSSRNQHLNNNSSTKSNVIPAINFHESPNNSIIDTIEDLSTKLTSQDLSYLYNASQRPNQVPSAPMIGATPDIVEILSTIDIDGPTITVSTHGEILVLYDFTENCYNIYNISNLVSPTLLSSISLYSSMMHEVAIISTDSKTGFFTISSTDNGELVIIDLTNPTDPNIIANYPIPAYSSSIALSSDSQTLFLYGKILTIIDVSDPRSPRNISSFTPPSASPADLSGTKLYLNGDNLFLKDGDQIFILNISSLQTVEILATINATYSVDLAISSDGKNAFILSSNSPTQQFNLEIYNISNITSITQGLTLTVGTCLADRIYRLMSISPDNNYLYIAGCTNLAILNISNLTDPDPFTYIVNPIQWPYEITLSSDGRNAFVTVDQQVIILDLDFEVQVNPEINITAQFPPINGSSLLSTNSMAISSDSKTVFMLSTSHLEIISVSNITSPSILSIFNVTDPGTICESVTLSPDDQTAFLVCSTSMIILNISNFTSPTLITIVPISLPNFQFAISGDGQIGFLLTPIGMQILNLTDLNSPTNISTYNCSNGFTPSLIKLSQDAKTVFIFSLVYYNNNASSENQMEIVDISNLFSPTQIYSTEIEAGSNSDDDYYPAFVSITPDKGIATVTFDLSDCEFEYSTVEMPIVSSPPLLIEPISISPFLTIFSSLTSTAYIIIDTGLLVVDISAITSPVLLRAFSINSAASLVLSADESTAFLGMEDGTLTILDLTPQYSLYILKRNFVLGEVYSTEIIPLQFYPYNIFTTIDQDFSILQVSLYDIDLVPLSSQNPVTYPALPSWISFDKNQGTLTFSPHLPTQIGFYQIYAVLSTVVPDDAFVGIGTITNTTESLDLLTSLISLGYIDTQGFLTSSFNPNNKKLFLPSEYSQYQAKIFNTLLQYYIQVVTTISVAPSLSIDTVTDTMAYPTSPSVFSISSSKMMSINTRSQNSLNLIISFDTGQSSSQGQFVSSALSAVTTISDNQATMNLDGSLLDINVALTQIIVNLDDGITSCDGIMMVSDGLNPTLIKQIDNISDYFTLNTAPTLNPNFSIQAQLSQTPVLTGEQFLIDLTNMFIDSHDQDLKYSLSMQDSTQQVPEWLTLRGEAIIGTPPDQISDSKINLVITASNQFKSTSQQITIDIKISLLYALKLVATYGGALITIIGFYVYLGTIYNILCKKRYRYPKDFDIKVGDKSTVQKICGICFVKEEINASKLILHNIIKTIAEEKNVKAIKNADLVNYFINHDSQQLDEDKFIRMIRAGLSKISQTQKAKDKEKASPLRFHLRIEVIKQLIINDIINQQLNFAEEALTKRIFKKIKDDWINMGEISRDSSFKLNKDKLEKKLRQIGIQSYNPQTEINPASSESILDSSDQKVSLNHRKYRKKTSPQSQNIETKFSIEEDKSKEISLIDLQESKPLEEKRRNINFSLLENAIIAHAFKYHNLNANAFEVEVITCEKTFGTSLYQRLKKFFKRDLYPVKFVKGCEIGYGITYKIHKGAFRFYGTPHEDIKGRTLAIQVVNRRGRILSEIWLDCLAKTGEEEEMLNKELIKL